MVLTVYNGIPAVKQNLLFQQNRVLNRLLHSADRGRKGLKIFFMSFSIFYIFYNLLVDEQITSRGQIRPSSSNGQWTELGHFPSTYVT